MENVSDSIEKDVDKHGHLELNRINEELVTKALRMLMPNKCDALFDTMSDFYINGPPEQI